LEVVEVVVHQMETAEVLEAVLVGSEQELYSL
jgi:hypothetical protein